MNPATIIVLVGATCAVLYVIVRLVARQSAPGAGVRRALPSSSDTPISNPSPSSPTFVADDSSALNPGGGGFGGGGADAGWTDNGPSAPDSGGSDSSGGGDSGGSSDSGS